MTPEQYQQFQQMQATINELTQMVNSLKMSSTITKEVDSAFRDRFKIIEGGSEGTFGTQSINLSGDPETINVPAQPSGTLKVTFENKQYELLVK